MPSGASIHFVAKASRQQGQCRRCGVEIHRGSPYYWIRKKAGGGSHRQVFCGDHKPRPSETTSSSKRAALYGAREAIGEAMSSATGDLEADLEELVIALRSAVETAEETGQEYARQSKLPSFGSYTKRIQRELGLRGQQCRRWKYELEQAANEIETLSEMPESNEDLWTKALYAASLAADSLEL